MSGLEIPGVYHRTNVGVKDIYGEQTAGNGLYLDE